ncbi:hypothetical protein SEA_CAELUM_73 [Streptomyces phage Caelum]|uniref:Uncharacterized protein n=1 Tax=Streptomyces phage Caelum TaxID=2530160 RepID=A0A481W045_9CAUD|nr:hypothetical protein KGG86_gp73 [Streptomyces phage Caelum]QBI99433.1 hypothetical protein SEA_CAELUM_73 [Streptomyces phage Caelum]
MPSTEEISKYITDQTAQDIIDTASAGITYWATEPTDEEFAGLPEGKTWTIVEGTAPHPIFPFDDEREVEGVYYLNADDIREAYRKLLSLDQALVGREIHGYVVDSWINRDEKQGIDTAHIDAGTADVIVQVAALEEVRYG